MPDMPLLRRCRCPVAALLLLLLLAAAALPAAAERVALPLTIEYPLLQSLLIGKAFREGNESATLVNEGNGCILLALSHPRVEEDQGFIRLEMEVTARVGTPMLHECLMPAEWRGYLVLHQSPVVNAPAWQLSFRGRRALLLDKNRRQVQIAPVLWQLIESRVFGYIEGIAIDLAPPVANLKAFLLPLFPPDVQQQTRTMLDSLRPGEVALRREAVTLQVLADVKEAYRPHDDRLTRALTGQELEEVVAAWEQWDALLSYLVATLARDLLSPEEQRLLRDVLLETRYAFVENLGNHTVTHDFVRAQFAEAWRQLAPVFRNHLKPSATSQQLGYLSFFTAADALTALDGLGPTFGIEISRNGLLRLAGMISDDPAALRYSPAIDVDLQHLFRLLPSLSPPPTTDPGPLPRLEAPPSPGDPPSGNGIIEEVLPPLPPADGIIEEELPPLPPAAIEEPLSRLWRFFCPLAHAAELPGLQEIRRWQVPETGVDDYVQRVVRLLESQAQATAAGKGVPASFLATYRVMMAGLAWQESCFRQFVVRNNRLTFLLSSNNSSVGLMQVNVRVWRGIYDQERLRWDIAYNAAAGCEIATMYLLDYALQERKGEKRPDNETLARLVYAMYHGGPAQYRKFGERLRGGKLSDSDRLFWEKFRWVSSASWDKIDRCLSDG